MSRLGPRLKIVRRLGTPLPGLTAEDGERRPYPPGQHGQSSARRRKASLFRRRLEEKQKVRFHYGVSEAQLRRAFAIARRSPGRTGDALLELLESRLDNLVFRLGFARTIPMARQLVVHGHILVNDRRVDRPAYRVVVGDVIALQARTRENVHLRQQLERGPRVPLPGWLARDPTPAATGRLVAPPLRQDVPFQVDEAAIVEHYAR